MPVAASNAASDTASANLYEVLAERGLIAQSTAADARERLAHPVTAYIGFDPTADSLHVGSLVPVMALAWLQRCGHRPLVVVGGATALIGDPSGKTSARRMLSREDIAANAAGLRAQLARFLRFDDSPTGAVLLDNADWLGGLTWIDLLREAGPCFSVNRMLSMDSVKGRMEAGGITFLEFNYMVMQAYDFLHLHRVHGCSLQMGGQDQWGNIVMGIDLARRLADAELFGLTLPLVTRSDGGKFGKSEQGNIWLAAERTPVHDFFQFWRNAADADVARFLAYFTALPMADIRVLTAAGGASLNAAKERLAIEVTRTVHGEAAMQAALDSARRAFGAGDVGGEAIPHADLARSELASGVRLFDLVLRTGFAASKSEARRLYQQGGVSIDGVVFDPAVTQDPQLRLSDLPPGDRLVVRVGKKRMFRFDLCG